ncbi:MAG: NAD(P)-dependent oxidoreductase [Proteobacteria bacterium]|nr:NAD(P)-dependent oxidoreductase [Pseudomonadota bacterium]
MRYLITGGTGFIGGHLIERLVAEGHAVTALVRSPHKAKRLEELGVTLLPGDLSLFADEVDLDPVDVVVHLAGVVAAQDPDQYEAINFTAVVDLMDCLERQAWSPKRLLFASSLAAAGPSPADRAWTEADVLAPIEPYGEAKMRAEQTLKGASFPVTSFRPPIVLGPGDPAFLTLFKAGMSRVGVRVLGPAQRLSWVFVDDLISAIVRMSEDTRDGDYTYYTSSQEVVDTDRLWNALRRALNRSILVIPLPGWVLSLAASVATRGSAVLGLHNQLDHKQVAQMRAPAFVCDSEALRTDLGWATTVGFDDAMHRTADGYRKLGWL